MKKNGRCQVSIEGVVIVGRSGDGCMLFVDYCFSGIVMGGQ